MKTAALLAILFTSALLCGAQETILNDAKRDLTAARAEIKKVVTFCDFCETSGKIDGKPCPHCDGRGAILASEAKIAEHKLELELKAERLGAPKSNYAEYDVANRLQEFRKGIESEAFEMFKAYVAYVKVYRKYEDLLEEDERFQRMATRVIEQLDALIARHGPRLRIQSLKLLYEDEPTGKVGAFQLPGQNRIVQIDGKDVERLELRTLKAHSVLLMRDRAKPRRGFVLAEIIGKGVYRTDDGKEITGILLQAY